MTKKYFNRVATILRDYRASEKNGDGYDLEGAFASLLQEDNPNFNQERFLEACKITKE
jgi:hypothetical protein